MTRNIYLNGKMGELFGKVWKLNAATVKEAMHGIDVQREGKLKQYLVNCTEEGIQFTVQKGEEFLGYDNLQMELGKDDLIITPIPAGAISDTLKAIIGIALVIGSFFIDPTGSTGLKILKIGMMLVGSMLAMQGITQMMAPDDPSAKEDGFAFNGPENTIKQGIPVPLCYGQLMVGGAPINFGFTGDITRPVGFSYAGKQGASAPNSDDPVGRYCFVSGSDGDSGSGNRSNDVRSDNPGRDTTRNVQSV